VASQDKTDWHWPEEGTQYHELEAQLDDLKKMNINYAEDVVMGFPGTTPLPEAVLAVSKFVAIHPNNITVHTLGIEGERGFNGTQEMEKQAIYTIANLIGVKDPEREVDGYICSGGTDGNYHGMWLGREKLRQTTIPEDSRQGTIVLATFLTHYSVDKNFGRLFSTGIPTYAKDYRRYGNHLEHLPTNKVGELTPEIVEEALSRYLAEGFHRFLFVLNAGTINLGSIDQIEAINAKILEMQAKAGGDKLHVYIHVDAAFGGFVIPFLHPEIKFGFENSLVGSVSLDAHKMLYVPYPAGVFLCRKNDLAFTTTTAPYLEAGEDMTVNGSRPGTSAVAIWTAIKVLGRKGCEERLKQCVEVLEYLSDQLRLVDPESHHYPTQLNVQTVLFSPAAAKALKDLRSENSKSFCVPTETLPKDFTKPSSLVHNGPSVKVHRFLTTPTLTREKVDKFIAALKGALEKPE
jgi:tyrosine decarboxylase / aspartate 1-decarboxylase